MCARIEDLSTTKRTALRSLAVDRVTAEAVGALRRGGVRPILLKGPSFTGWLYGSEAPHGYGDSDLLVSPDDIAAAELVLERLGFVKRLGDVDTPGWRQAACEWRRARDGASVDLHRTMIGVEADGRELWAAFSEATVAVTVGAGAVEALSLGARTLHVALHAAQHGTRDAASLADLDRALASLDESVWREAGALAHRVNATAAFATGLRLRPAGEAVAERLRLPVARSTEVALLATTPPPAALGWEHFAGTRGWVARAHFIARKVVPTTRLVQAWSPLASRGRLGLAAAYVWRPVWLLRHAWPGFVAWRRARRRQ